MAELRFRPTPSSAFDRQYKKLSNEDKELADEAIKALTKLVNGDPKTEEAKQQAQRLRVKPIQRFAGKKPKRMEATFAPDGRIVWALEKPHLLFIYIGNHSVLDKK